MVPVYSAEAHLQLHINEIQEIRFRNLFNLPDLPPKAVGLATAANSSKPSDFETLPNSDCCEAGSAKLALPKIGAAELKLTLPNTGAAGVVLTLPKTDAAGALELPDTGTVGAALALPNTGTTGVALAPPNTGTRVLFELPNTGCDTEFVVPKTGVDAGVKLPKVGCEPEELLPNMDCLLVATVDCTLDAEPNAGCDSPKTGGRGRLRLVVDNCAGFKIGDFTIPVELAAVE